MADDIVTSVVSSVGTWTFRTALILFFLGLMAAVYLLDSQKNKLYEDMIKMAKETNGATLELLECKAEAKMLKELLKK